MIRYQFLRFPEGKPKAVTLSYDDGHPSDLRLSDTVTKYGLKCTFNLNGISYRGEKSFSRETAEEYVFSRGHEVAVWSAFFGKTVDIEIVESHLRGGKDCVIKIIV